MGARLLTAYASVFRRYASWPDMGRLLRCSGEGIPKVFVGCRRRSIAALLQVQGVTIDVRQTRTMALELYMGK